ncbi:MAG: bifunctional deaminase-reductase domain protein [Pseudonocardiales bacterium]|nr:bifunctional deaminase-reductase domain protein [Pseudonocardiales bacterium]
MRELLPVAGPVPDLHDVYATDWLESGGVRVNFVSSVDGAVALSGKSRGLQTPGDNRVFAALRDLADVVLVGAGTARDEGYRPVVPDERRWAARERYGLAPLLPVALVSARLDLDVTGPLFTGDERSARTIVITHAASPTEKREQLAEFADVIVAGAEAVDFASARDQLAERELTRVLSEGGPSLFARLLAHQVVDELCLTVSPLLAGAGSGRIVAGEPWPDDLVPKLSLHTLLEEDDALFYRYRVSR